MEHRIGEKVVKTSIGPDKIANLVKNLTKLLPTNPQTPSVSSSSPSHFDTLDLASVIEDGKKWSVIEDKKWGGISHRNKDNVLTPASVCRSRLGFFT